MMSKRVAKVLQFLQPCLRFGKRCLRHRDYATASFATPAQTHDASNFIETETERLCFANEPHPLQRGIVVDAIAACRSRWLREEPAPLVKADRIGPHPESFASPPIDSGFSFIT